MTRTTIAYEKWYRTVWRWHFYAGLFTVPFILWLSVTGGIYLFKPQIETLLDRPYDGLEMQDQPMAPSSLANIAVNAVPGSVLHRYVLPEAQNDARRIIVGVGPKETRIYLHPETGKILKTVGEEDQLMRVVFRLHGELMAGRWGSALVELAASWAIVMLLTGLFLWWPRDRRGSAGVLYPRIGQSGRIFWRDMHAVTGVWVSLAAIFLILSGLPWAKNWSDYLGEIRNLTGTVAVQQDWSQGSEADAAARRKLDAGARAMMAEHSEHGGGTMQNGGPLSALDKLVPVAQSMNLAAPAEIYPPTDGTSLWTLKSNASNRPLRTNVQMDGMTGMVVGREDFRQRHWIDRVVGYGIAIHEGAYFGLANQLLSLLTILGLMLLSVSSIIMWWRRRPDGVVGAPAPKGKIRHSWLLLGLTILLAIVVPLFGLSLGIVVLFEHFLLRQYAYIRNLLSLRTQN